MKKSSLPPAAQPPGRPNESRRVKRLKPAWRVRMEGSPAIPAEPQAGRYGISPLDHARRAINQALATNTLAELSLTPLSPADWKEALAARGLNDKANLYGRKECVNKPPSLTPSCMKSTPA
jgi:hypothetical protein